MKRYDPPAGPDSFDPLSKWLLWGLVSRAARILKKSGCLKLLTDYAATTTNKVDDAIATVLTNVLDALAGLDQEDQPPEE
ncbi:hypothetical protein ES705_23533 [subsurface metagenome]